MTEPCVSRYFDAEAADVARFLTRSAARDPTLQPASVDGWRAFTRLSFNRGARDFRVARAGGRMVAILTSTMLARSGLPHRHFRIIVGPDERRRGIGTLLLGHVETQEPAHGVVLQCNCRDSWSAGREFLKRSAFEVSRRCLEMELRDLRVHSVRRTAESVIRSYRATSSDDADWLRLEHEGYADDPDAQRPIADDLEVRRRKPGFRLWLVERDGTTVGFLHATAGARARIHSLVVAPDVRGRGFALALMIHAIRALRREGATAVTLGVRSENGPAVGLYRGIGFEVVEEEEMWQRAVP